MRQSRARPLHQLGQQICYKNHVQLIIQRIYVDIRMYIPDPTKFFQIVADFFLERGNLLIANFMSTGYLANRASRARGRRLTVAAEPWSESRSPRSSLERRVPIPPIPPCAPITTVPR